MRCEFLTRLQRLAALETRPTIGHVGQSQTTVRDVPKRMGTAAWASEAGPNAGTVSPAFRRERMDGRRARRALWEADCIRRALAGIDTPIVLLKGAAYLVAGLPPARGRIFSDVDILVEHSKLKVVESALFAAGWISEERDAYNDRYYREWMHELPPMRHVQRGTSIDVHHTITPPTSRFKVEGGQLLSRIQAIPGHPGLYTLSPVDMVLHSMTHLFFNEEFSADSLHRRRPLLGPIAGSIRATGASDSAVACADSLEKTVFDPPAGTS